MRITETSLRRRAIAKMASRNLVENTGQGVVQTENGENVCVQKAKPRQATSVLLEPARRLQSVEKQARVALLNPAQTAQLLSRQRLAQWLVIQIIV